MGLSSIVENISINEFIIYMLSLLIYALITMYIGYYIMIFTHELGHMFFGFVTGYRFLLFRVCTLVIVLKDNKLRIKRYRNERSIGQCILLPPKNKDSYFFMMAGGIIFNLISGTITLLILFFLKYPFHIKLILAINSYLNYISVFMNMSTFKSNRSESDGLCLKNLFKNKISLNSHYKQLYITEEILKGMKYSEMDGSLFDINEQADMINEINASMYLYRYYRQLGLGDIKAAKNELKIIKLLEGHYTKGLQYDIAVEELFCKYLLGEDIDIEKYFKLLEKETRNPHVLRILIIIYYNKKDVINYEKYLTKLESQITSLYTGEIYYNQDIVKQWTKEDFKLGCNR